MQVQRKPLASPFHHPLKQIPSKDQSITFSIPKMPPLCDTCVYCDRYDVAESGTRILDPNRPNKVVDSYLWFCCHMHMCMHKHENGFVQMDPFSYRECLRVEGKLVEENDDKN